MMEKRALTRCIGTLTAALLSCAALAQAPVKDPKAQIQAAMESAAGLDSLGFTEAFKGTVVAKGSTSEVSLTGEMVLRGKDGLSALFTMQNEKVRLVSDGKTHFLYIIGDTTFQKTGEVIPRTQLMCVVTRGAVNAAAAWVAGFLHNKADLLDTAETVEAKGGQNIEGTACEGYLLAYPAYDVTVWLTQSNPPALRRADMDMTEGSQNQAGGPTSATVQVNITNWKPNVETQDSQFVFTPPDGVEEVKPGGNPLEGKAAPDFEVPLLDGGTLKLSSMKGKTVVLDIWATWCGPCRRAMPIVEKVSEEFADKGVVLYAVNQREEPEAIRKFLETSKLNPKVALDQEGKVSRAYQADSIPRIVIVGPDGIIRKVFRGLSPDFENELRGVLSTVSQGAAPAK